MHDHAGSDPATLRHITRKEPIRVLVSGGVDSGTALARLRHAGFRNVHAYYLKIWLEDELSSLGSCPWEEDLHYAGAVCDQLDVPLSVVSLQLEYYERVVEYALSELRSGRTPSPDIFCNQRIKFGAFLAHVGSDGWVASGHYARLVETPDGVHLYRAPDPVKDQTYFLSHMSQEQFRRVVFPIGDLPKGDVRALAARYRLAVCTRPDSQGICFLGKIRYPDFVRHYLGVRRGPIVERETGRSLGEHDGYWFHTVGQRQGLGLGNGPWYVVAKDIDSNTVFVSHRNSVDANATDTVELGSMNWIGVPGTLDRSRQLGVKLRHGPHIEPCTVETVSGETDSARACRVRVRMRSADRGVAAGQFGILYDGDRCLGGGTILSASAASAPPGDSERLNEEQCVS